MKRTTKVLSSLLAWMLLFNSMVFSAVSEEALPVETETASDMSAVITGKYEAGDEIVEWSGEGVKHYYLGDGQYQAVVSYTEPATPGNNTQSYLSETATRASTTGQVQTEQLPYDTFISSTNKSTNYGTEEKLWVGTNDTTFIYDFLPDLPDNADVTAAQLYFSYYYNITTGYLTVGAYPVNFEWSEEELTWNIANTQSNLGLGTTCLGTKQLNGTKTVTTTSVTVTDAVKSWYASKELNNYGIALKRLGGTNNSVILVPFDAYDDNAPYFVVDYVLNDLPITDGLYYIRNGRLDSQFMQPDDGLLDDDDVATADMFYELWELDCEEYQKWEIEYLHNGYYTISNSVGNGTLVLAVKEGEENTGNTEIIRELYTGHIRQQWQITLTSSGKYKIKPRSSETYTTDWVLCAGSGLDSLPNGRNVEQRVYNGTNGSYYDEWKLHRIDKNICMLGIAENEHDHYSCYSSVMNDLYNGGYDGFNLIYCETLKRSKLLTEMQGGSIFVSRSHGGRYSNSDVTYIEMGDGSEYELSSYSFYNYNTNTPVVDLTSYELMLFVGCNTAETTTKSICDGAVQAGAGCAIGFSEKVFCDPATAWTAKFFELYATGNYTIEDCCQEASDFLDGEGGIDSFVIFDTNGGI